MPGPAAERTIDTLAHSNIARSESREGKTHPDRTRPTSAACCVNLLFLATGTPPPHYARRPTEGIARIVSQALSGHFPLSFLALPKHRQLTQLIKTYFVSLELSSVTRTKANCILRKRIKEGYWKEACGDVVSAWCSLSHVGAIRMIGTCPGQPVSTSPPGPYR